MQYELAHFKGNMGHDATSDAGAQRSRGMDTVKKNNQLKIINQRPTTGIECNHAGKNRFIPHVLCPHDTNGVSSIHHKTSHTH